MRHLKITMIMAASLVLTVLLGLAGCGDDHRGHAYYVQDRPPEVYGVQRQDTDRHDERQDSDRHEDRGRDSGHEDEHGDR